MLLGVFAKFRKVNVSFVMSCITPAVYIKTTYRSPVGRPVITFYTLCLGGNLSAGLPLQISSDWNVIFEVRNSHANKWTTQCCISQHAEHFNVSLHVDYLKAPASYSRLKSNHYTHCPSFEVYTTGTNKKPGSNPIYTKLISILQTYITSAIVGQVPT